jgi:hypothetical protein
MGMPKMVIEVPEQLRKVGEAMAEQLAERERTIARHGGGKAVEYGCGTGGGGRRGANRVCGARDDLAESKHSSFMVLTNRAA